MKKTKAIPENSDIAKKISYLSGIIKQNGSLLTTKKATVGFDGFVDTIVKIIRNKQKQKPPTLFNKIKEFGNYIVEKEETSFSLELEEISIKLGGNMPIMANALGRLSVPVNCVGALGYPQPHPVFKNLSSHCRIYSFADPGTSTAFEFKDGKIMLAHMGELNNLGWNKIKNIVGIDTLVNLYKESVLLAILNWSEIDASPDIWKGLLTDVFPRYTIPHEKQIAFFDLSDCSKRSKKTITEALNLLKEFEQYTRVILSLNKNEAQLIYSVLVKKKASAGLTNLGEEIFEKLKIDGLLLHSSREAIGINAEGSVSCNSFFMIDPKISTGAGDNFNAGFAVSQILDLDLESSLIFAHAVSGLYVRTGISPQLTDVINFLKEIKEK